MDHTTPPPAHADFIRSPLGIALLMLVSTAGGGWLRDRLSTEGRDTASVVRVEALEKRIDQLQAAQSDYQRSGLTSNQFNEFRTANEKRLDDIREDLKNLIAEVNAVDHLKAMNK